MDLSIVVWISLAVLCMATLYSMVGHGGGSGYLAVLAIAAIAPEQMRPTALVLNVVVSSVATWKFVAAGTFKKNLFVPLVCASIPFAFLGGYIEIASEVYKPIVGAVLLFAAIRLCIPIQGAEKTNQPVVLVLVLAGAIIGFFSGVIGVGGGIFLSPLILLLGWTNAKQTAAISAPFILVNSISGLGGIALEHSGLPIQAAFVLPLVVSVLIGGSIGATLGSKKIGHQGLRTILGVVLLVAALKMFVTMTSGENEPVADKIKSIHE